MAGIWTIDALDLNINTRITGILSKLEKAEEDETKRPNQITRDRADRVFKAQRAALRELTELAKELELPEALETGRNGLSIYYSESTI